MDDTVSGLWKRCEKLEAERDELQRKLNIAVEANNETLKLIDYIKQGDYPKAHLQMLVVEVALKKLEEMNRLFPDKDDITFGGFIKSNIRRAIIDDCLSSGDPVNMFRAIEDEIGLIRDEIDEIGGYEYWEKEMENWNNNEN